MSPGTGVDLPAGYDVLDLPASPALPLSFARAALRAAGVGGGSRELPRVAYRLAGVRPDPAHVARYADVVGGPRAGRLPLLYPNALSFPLQMALMTAPGFPFPVIGMVHLENTVRQGRGLVAGTALDLEVRAENLRPHRLGQVLDVVTVVRQGGHVAWTQVGTFLRRGGKGPDGARTDAGPASSAAPDDAEGADDAPLHRIGTWALDAGLGRAYAAVAGDRNPIHLYPLTAKAFGFSRPIAHGLWTAARLTHAVEAGMPADVTCVARFRKPVPLPSTVDVLADRTPGEGAGPVHAQVRRQDAAGTVCCDLVLRPGS
ncbi:MaoC/PaaZ C-terminal domain-containing protein [Kineosporia sp. R_H_3]|uniref:MaoC/PaaZ C-terminal domain-containing protein n=1 Tax=Kineosporia sp. R_H_3 TaxID=1961848 RepID=UPI000B4B2981|nr:MaoC/PaaZ C-terminal domain-containing protein [Kineosporia sp. R_H_3]